MANSANENKVQFLVLADSRKLLKQKTRSNTENSIFEATPNNLVNQFILETGYYKPEDLVNLLEDVEIAEPLKQIN